MNKLKLPLLLGVLVMFASCKKFLDVNDNPNAPVNVPVEQLLPGALISSANIESGALNQLGAVWTGYWAKAVDGPSTVSLFRLEETYAVKAMSFDRDGRPFWEDIYKILTNYKNIETKASADGDLVYAGIAKIMQGWHFMRLVDLYNNVPFEEAIQGTVYATPRFEDGKRVYDNSVNLITKGIDDIKNATVLSKKPAADDIVFKGALTKWIRFANTIKLRALLRQSQAGDNAYINTEIAKIIAEGTGFLTDGESALVDPGFLVTAGKQNPLWETYYRNPQGALTAGYNTLRPTAFVVDQYKATNDPRLVKLYARPKGGGDYKGVPLGTDAGIYSMDNTSALMGPVENGNQPGAIFKSAVSPIVLMGSFESLFLQAEAAQRGWINSSARVLYETAVKESFKYMEVPDSEYDGYIVQPLVDYDNAPNKIERIIVQKWMALNSLSSIEAWNDYRRLGYPSNLPQSLASPNSNLDYRPLRLTYRQSEISGNAAEVEKQGNIDPFVSRVFWDK